MPFGHTRARGTSTIALFRKPSVQIQPLTNRPAGAYEVARELFGEHPRLNSRDGVDAWLEKEGFTPGKRAAP
jgi:hypothetical protein